MLLAGKMRLANLLGLILDFSALSFFPKKSSFLFPVEEKICFRVLCVSLWVFLDTVKMIKIQE